MGSFKHIRSSEPVEVTVQETVVQGGGTGTLAYHNQVDVDNETDLTFKSQNAVDASPETDLTFKASNQLTAAPESDLTFKSDNAVDLTNSTKVIIPDLAPAEDTYLERNNGTSSFGSATGLLAKNNTAVVNDDKNTYIAWDFTQFNTGTVDSAVIDIFCSENVAVGGLTANYGIFTNPTKPFEETTATWDSDEQPPGTSRQTGTISVNSATPTLTQITLNATARANITGNWVYLRLTGTSDGLGLNTLTTESKESANSPLMDLEVSL